MAILALVVHTHVRAGAFRQRDDAMLVDAQQDAEEEAAGGMSRSGGGGGSRSGAGAVQELAVKAAEEAGALLSDTAVLNSR